MRIVQLLPTIAPGDAVSSDARALQRLLRRWDRHTEICAENISPALRRGSVLPAERLRRLGPEDVLIYHMSIGSELSLRIDELRCRKLMIYHNITPPDFFAPYSDEAALLCRRGLAELRRLSRSFDFCIADSEFNRQGLLAAGYDCPVEVCPVLIPFADYDAPAEEYTLRKYGDGRTNILFVGRIAPNKCQQDVIAAFAAYQRRFDSDARLILAGSSDGMELYEQRLRAYARAIGVRNVSFTGHIPFSRLLALYRTASAFLCMSEHEGFCVPLLEAMHFGVPVAAYDAGAVGETLGSGGLLFRDKDSEGCAGILRETVGNRALIQKGRQRLADFAEERVAERFAALFEAFLRRETPRRRRVLQVVPVMSRGDAVSSDILALSRVLDRPGVAGGIWTRECADPLLRSAVRCADTPPLLEAEDLAVFHMGMGSDMAEDFLRLKCRKALIYHNITPAEYFEPWDEAIARGCELGRRQTEKLAAACGLCVADSAYNAAELAAMGAPDPRVLPILIPFADYDAPPDERTLEKYGDGRRNILFVGRVVPNKKFEDVIRAFALYQKRFDPTARLILAGSGGTVPSYVGKLRGWCRALDVKNVVFTGKIPFAELLALYRSASAFLCMSEHEGFCVPLVEAMYFDVPIVARRAAAVGETLGESGLQLDSSAPEEAAAALEALRRSETLRRAVLTGQRRRLADFAPEAVLRQAEEIFGEVLHG